MLSTEHPAANETDTPPDFLVYNFVFSAVACFTFSIILSKAFTPTLQRKHERLKGVN